MKRTIAVLAFWMLAVPAWAGPAITINEIRVDQPGTDDDEFFELFGAADASLDGLTYIVIGDMGEDLNSGIVEAVVPLDGLTIPADGHFLAVEETFTLVEIETADLVTDLNFENSDNVTHMLVQGFTGALNDDLDTDDDGVFDTTPWTSIVDIIAFVENADTPPQGTEWHYGDFGDGTAIGPDGVFVPAHIFRLPTGTGPWFIARFDPAEDGLDSPGTANRDLTAFQGATMTVAGLTNFVVEPEAQGGAGGRFIRLLTNIPAGTGTLSDDGGVIAVFPHEVDGDLIYTPPNAGFRGTARFTFEAEDGQGTVSNTTSHIICVQDDTAVIAEVMHFPDADPSVHEFIEVYNYSNSDIDLWGLAGDLFETDGAFPNNLSGATIPANSMRIIAPATTVENDTEFECEWTLNPSDVIRVGVDTWEDINIGESLIGLYGDDAGMPYLIDAVWIREGHPSWFVQTFLAGHSLAMDGLFCPFPDSQSNNGDPDNAFCWSLNGFGGEFLEDGVFESEIHGQFGSPAYVPDWNTNPVYAASCFGECCLPDGSCTVTFEGDCTENLCGEFIQDDGDCGTDPPVCVIPVGACCTPAGDCLENISECECLQVGGNWQGDGADCPIGDCPDPTEVIVNEFDYDNPNNDIAEFIELLGPPGMDLTNWSIALYNGFNGTVYNTIDLTGHAIPADRFLVIGDASNVDNVDVNVPGNDLMQNGPPDGFALVDGNGVPVELVSYEGTFDGVDGPAAGMTFPDVGVTDAGATGSIQRIPNGFDWVLADGTTPGESNFLLLGACCIDGACSLERKADCLGAAGFYQGDFSACTPGLCDDTCRTLAEIRALDIEVGVHICDAVVSSTTDLIASNGLKSFQVQDGTGGVTIFGGNDEIDNILTGVVEGTEISLFGTTLEFASLLEVGDGDVALEREDIGAFVGIPAPLAITVADLQDGNPFAESIEAVLVELQCVIFNDAGGTFQGAVNYLVSNDGGLTDTEVRVSTIALDMVGTTIPSGYVNVKGVVGQFSFDDPAAGYQVQPRSLADFTVCNDPPTGACCTGVDCTIETFVDCDAMGGVYKGTDAICDANTCDAGACCLLLGGCDDGATQSDCEDGGGTFFGGEDCIDVECPDAVAACCLPDGTCEMQTELDCLDACGMWNDGMTCGEVVCVAEAVGQCCLPPGVCAVVSECECVAAGGTFDGGQTTCEGAECPAEFTVVINEIRTDQSGADNSEYFELYVTGGEGDLSGALEGMTYIVIGDGAGGSGTIEAVVPLTGQLVPGDGFFVAAEATFETGILGDVVDFETNLNFENGDNVTHMLLFGFTGADGDDLDIDDDGVLDSTPWTAVVDIIALVEEDNPPAGTEYHYGSFDDGTAVGPDGIFVPGHVFRDPDAGPWAIGGFDVGTDDTPGLPNSLVATDATIIDAKSYRMHGAIELAIDLDDSNGTESRLNGLAKVGFTMSEAMDGLTVDCANVQITCANDPMTCTSATLDVDGQTVLVEVTGNPVIDNCCTFAFDGVQTALGGGVADSYNVTVLQGDLDFNGGVSGGDASIVKPHFGEIAGVDLVHPKFDMNADGGVTGGDFSVIKPRLNFVAPDCP